MSATPQNFASRLIDNDMQAASAALLRAAQRARELASRTGTPSSTYLVVDVTAEEFVATDTLL